MGKHESGEHQQDSDRTGSHRDGDKGYRDDDKGWSGGQAGGQSRAERGTAGHPDGWESGGR